MVPRSIEGGPRRTPPNPWGTSLSEAPELPASAAKIGLTYHPADGFERGGSAPTSGLAGASTEAPSVQVLFWKLDGRLTEAEGRARVATEMRSAGGGTRWPEVVSVSTSDVAGLSKLHAEHLEPEGYRLVVPDPSGPVALLVRGEPAGTSASWQRKVNGRTPVAIQRHTVRHGDRNLTIFNVDMDAEALRDRFDAETKAIKKEFGPRIGEAKQNKDKKLLAELERQRRDREAAVAAEYDTLRSDIGTALRDLVEAHRLRAPDDAIVLTGNFTAAFDVALFGKEGFGTGIGRSQDAQRFLATGVDLLREHGRGASKLSKADRGSRRHHVDHGTHKVGKQAYAPTANILVGPELTGSGGLAQYVPGSFHIHDVPTDLGQHRPVSIQIDLAPGTAKKLVAPGVRMSPFTRSDPNALSERERPGVVQTYRVPGKMGKGDREQILAAIQRYAKRAAGYRNAGRDDILERLRLPRLKGLEFERAIARPFLWSDYEGLSPDETVAMLRKQTAAKEQITFANANWIHFHHLFNADGWVTDPFTGSKLQIEALQDPQSFNRVMNVEHIWPRSKGAHKSDAKGDLHHLIVMDSELNSRRGNLPYGNVVPGTEKWEGSGCKVGLDADGREVFEPPQALRGRLARALLWAALRHGAELTPLDRNTYLQWHTSTPPTDAERAYTARVSVYQGNRNPFIDMPEAVRPLIDHL